ncbi:hypothetical protein GCK72_015352 [Caenorhabditis remanei]|uniref:Major facilitator superfamily (MFS) profile domain-containing protein n=1 Tax=Caenorhabditis remanei TaxID=31234 RepID=A0A6A5GX16_CAERE|nr:hypothetical protein GCK72_015352 [Caenorhabditis remanei]KAF1758892.1 hypothetical protein GCK72_015352 [Caenorhabditis remanei]
MASYLLSSGRFPSGQSMVEAAWMRRRLLEESPRWLVQKGKMDEARRLLVKIRKIDRLYSEEFEKDLDEVLRIEAEKHAKSNKKKKKYTFIHLFCTWKMMAQTLTFIVGM